MQIRVLGKSPALTDAGGACSGYLIQEGDFTLLLDCGSGVFGNLRSVIDYAEVDAILITHLHADHFLDLIPFSFALKYSPRAPFRRPTLLAPAGAKDFFLQLGALIRFEDQIEKVFDVREYDERAGVQIGPISARFVQVPHYVKTFACDLATSAGKHFTFGADCGPNEVLPEFAAGTDLLVLEATEGAGPAAETQQIRGHLTAAEAGELAAKARAKRLLITHFSDELDAGALLREAQDCFGGEVVLAREGAVFTL